MSTKKVAVYARVARMNDYALENQEQVVVGFAKAKGFSDCTLYSDNGGSGLTLNRPGIAMLMNDIRNGVIDTVIVKDSTRISRSIPHALSWYDFVKKHGVNVISVHGEDLEFWGFMTKLLNKLESKK